MLWNKYFQKSSIKKGKKFFQNHHFKTLNHSQPDLSGNPFFALGKALAKKIGNGRRIKLPE
ncbi:hypothetical protein DTW91_06145 [Chryseobacterium sp. SC28]|nr:hypothetical protein DTW91_06145 [Chryseobacterium sp. SC28]